MIRTNIMGRFRSLNRLEKILFAAIGAGFLLHMFWVPWPITGWHSWRQADSAAVARNFYEGDMNPLMPRIDWGGLGPGYVETEAQIYTFFIAVIYKMVGVHEWIGRVLSLLFSMLTAYYLFLFGKVLGGRMYGLAAAAVFSISPMETYFGTSIMPESLLLLSLIIAIYHYNSWTNDGKIIDWMASLIFLSVAILIKPPSLYMGLPILWLSLNKYGWAFLRRIDIWLYVIILFAVTGAYYYNAHRIYLNYGNTFGIWMPVTDKWLNPDLLLSWEFYNRLIFSRISERLLTYGGFAAFIVGLFLKARNIERVINYWLIGVVIFLLVVARGNYVHDYYQLPVLLPASFVIARAFERLVVGKRNFGRYALIFAFSIIPLLSVARNITFARHAIDELPNTKFAGKLDVMLPDDARVITLYGGSPTLLYHMHRKGWSRWPDREEIEGIRTRADSSGVYVVGTKQNVENISNRSGLDKGKLFLEEDNLICIRI